MRAFTCKIFTGFFIVFFTWFFAPQIQARISPLNLNKNLENSQKYNFKTKQVGLDSMAFNLFQAGDIEGSLIYYNRVLQEYQKQKDVTGEIKTYLSLGENYTALKVFDKASINLDLAKLLFPSKPPKEFLLRYYNLYTILDTAKGNYKEAFFHNQKFLKAKDSFMTSDKESFIKNLSQNYTLAQKEKQKVIELVINQRFEAKQKTAFLGGILLVSLLLIGMIFLFSLYRTKRKAFEQTKAASILIKEKNEELERLNQLKNKLFSIIAHDLRSPLNNLTGVLSLIGQGLLDHQEVLQITDKLTNNVKETTNFLDNLLIWSRSQMNGIQIHLQELDVFNLAKETLEVFRFQCEEKKLSIKNLVQESLLVYADREMIRIVLRNLISNSIKFSLADGSIIIKAWAKEEDELAIISVHDEGIGIKNELQNKLFGVDNYTTLGTKEEKGSGIGLMLCRDFVERNGGKIWMESTPGKGSVFLFSLPQYHMAIREEGIKDLLADII